MHELRPGLTADDTSISSFTRKWSDVQYLATCERSVRKRDRYERLERDDGINLTQQIAREMQNGAPMENMHVQWGSVGKTGGGTITERDIFR
jgi:hypothetical protein